MISGYLRANNGPQVDGYLRSEKYPFRFDGFLQGNLGPQNDGYLRSRKWAFDVVAEAGPVGPVSGSAAQILAALTQSATGKLYIRGSAGQVLGTLTQDATGRLVIKGLAGQTLADVTQSATGRLVIHGVAGQVLDGATQAALGRLRITGTAAQTLGALSQIAFGELSGGVLPDEPTRGKGGWDPYYYKPRRKKAKKRDEVEQFLAETAQLETAPAPVQEAAEDARDAAQDYLAALHQASQREAQRLLAEALDRIDAFYEAAREAAEEEEEIELLLLS